MIELNGFQMLNFQLIIYFFSIILAFLFLANFRQNLYLKFKFSELLPAELTA